MSDIEEFEERRISQREKEILKALQTVEKVQPNGMSLENLSIFIEGWIVGAEIDKRL